MKKIKEVISKVLAIGKDKIWHFVAGLFIAFFIGLISPKAGIIAAVLAGAAKELYDAFSKKGTAEWLDLVATAIGGAIGMVMAIL